MSHQRKKTARAIATTALNQFDPKCKYAGLILKRLLPITDEKQRATDLVFGTIRNRTAIDTVIAEFANCPVDRIPPRLLNIIRVAAYELIYSPATPEYSIVNEAVENAKAAAGRKQVGFVNAVLRQITRHITNREIPLSQTDAGSMLPQSPATGCEFDTVFLPDPVASPADYFSTAFSLPKWLVAGWLEEFGEEATKHICFAGNRRPSVYIRPNTLKTTAAELGEKLRHADIDFEIAPNVIGAEAGIQTSGDANARHLMIRLKAARAVTDLPGFAEGLFTVQDITSSLPVRLLNPQPGWRILDLCAAPGAKTTQLAEATNDSAEIIATDIDPDRLKLVEVNITRLGIGSISIVPYDELNNSQFPIPNSQSDCVLLDVPCSNTGVLARRPEVRYRVTPKAVAALTKTQMELLKKAATLLKPQGKICYSTCSIEKAENSELVRPFLLKNRDFKLESELFTLPSADQFYCDGGYVAIIARR
jgi:16S rRNA (cytosine967-C5)-methyltransferase